MLRLIIIITAMLISLIYGQNNQEVLFPNEITHGGYGAPVVKYTKINKKDALLVGGKGGWIINNQLVIGLGGYGLVNEIEFNNPHSSIYDKILFGYGGLYFEYVYKPNKLIHISTEMLVGGGGLSAADELWHNHDHGWYSDNSPHHTDTDAFFVVEPGFNFIINLFDNVRVGTGCSYRHISGVELDGLSDTDLSNFTGQVFVKFGLF